MSRMARKAEASWRLKTVFTRSGGVIYTSTGAIPARFDVGGESPYRVERDGLVVRIFRTTEALGPQMVEIASSELILEHVADG